MLYFVYIARCKDGSLYTGMCMDLIERERIHNAGKGAKYTRARLPISFVYSETFTMRTDAFKREAAIKKLSKSQKELLVSESTQTSA